MATRNAHEHTTDVRDVIIVGSGPAGYTAAVYAARADLKPLVFEGSITAGGALMNTTDVENFPGFRDGIMGPELMENMRAQAERFGAELVTEDITEMDLTGPIKIVRDGYGNSFAARAVILAMGSAYRKLGIPDEDRLSGHGVSWCATCDGFFFRDKDIAVVGGGDTAMEEATFLSRFARSVTIIHRRESSGPADHGRAGRERPEDQLRLVLRGHGCPRREELTASRCATPGPVRSATSTSRGCSSPWATTRARNSYVIRWRPTSGYVITDGTSTRTNLPGVFASGDLVDHTYRQAITAAGTGCAAALDAERYLADLNDTAEHTAALQETVSV